MSNASTDPAITNFYFATDEATRLDSHLGQLEGLRTRALITEHAPKPPATVCDVGGAAGAYSFWLANAGYDVHLVDPVTKHIDTARDANNSAQHKLASLQVGDARRLPFSDSSADFILLLGPLYHLTDADDRTRAIAEARRVLKPGGLLFAAAISRWASAIDGLARDLFANPAFGKIVERDALEGQHRNVEENPEYFTTSYFHKPEELRGEIAAQGFAVKQVYGLEGPAAMLDDFNERWADARKRANIVRVAELTGAEPSIVGDSPHLLAVAARI